MSKKQHKKKFNQDSDDDNSHKHSKGKKLTADDYLDKSIMDNTEYLIFLPEDEKSLIGCSEVYQLLTDNYSIGRRSAFSP